MGSWVDCGLWAAESCWGAGSGDSLNVTRSNPNHAPLRSFCTDGDGVTSTVYVQSKPTSTSNFTITMNPNNNTTRNSLGRSVSPSGMWRQCCKTENTTHRNIEESDEPLTREQLRENYRRREEEPPEWAGQGYISGRHHQRQWNAFIRLRPERVQVPAGTRFPFFPEDWLSLARPSQQPPESAAPPPYDESSPPPPYYESSPPDYATLPPPSVQGSSPSQPPLARATSASPPGSFSRPPDGRPPSPPAYESPPYQPPQESLHPTPGVRGSLFPSPYERPPLPPPSS
jgi:hypothetical protein